MLSRSLIFLLPVSLLACHSALAGGDGKTGAAPSKNAGAANTQPGGGAKGPVEFPYVYRQVGYLATVGPAPLRFAPATPRGSERTPPRVGARKVHEISAAAEAQARAEALDAYRTEFGRRLSVADTVAPPSPEPNFGGGQEGSRSGAVAPVPILPPEISELFERQSSQGEEGADAQKRRMRILMDPIFHSAMPPSPAPLPPSSATFRQN